MRKGMWLAALGLGLAWAGAAQAQQAMTFGPVIGPIQYTTITGDMSKFPIGGTFQRPTGFRLTDLFGSTARMTAKPLIGTTNFPTFGDLPGKAYLAPFQVQRARPAQ
jgi:hypothetical protein